MDRVQVATASAGPRRCTGRSTWLGGVSLVALLLASGEVDARNINSIGTVAPTAAVSQAAIAAAQQAAAAAAQGQSSLARAATALAAARRAQQGAAALSTQPLRANGQAIPDGVGDGGLMPTGGVTGSSCGTSCTAFQLNTPDSFKNADPTLIQTVNGGQTKVDITQTQKKAIYDWDSFNISRSTTLNFNQQASDWTALNRVDPNQSPLLFLQNATSNNGRSNPSYIGGRITAPGGVYVINRNGIIFGAGAQVNVHTLIASTLDVGKLGDDQAARNNYFLTTGIVGDPNTPSFSLFDPDGGKTSSLITGNVTVEAGASITANIATDNAELGSPATIYLLGANVANYGTLTAPQGRVVMAAGRAITLTPGSYQAADFPSAVKPSNVTFRGTGVQLQKYGITFSDTTGDPNDPSYYRDDVHHIVTGEVTSGGVIDIRQGVATMAGDRVTVGNLQDAGGNAVRDSAGNLVQGVISADTGITRNSMVLMHAATRVRMDGVISMLPDDDGSALPLQSGAASSDTASNVQSFTPAYVEMSAQLDVTVGASGLVSAPSAAVSLNAVALGGASSATTSAGTQRQLFNATNQIGNFDSKPTLAGSQQVLLSGSGSDGPGAVIDVAGLQNVVLPAAYNFITLNPLAQFADMPLQRAGVLYDRNGKTPLSIDIRASGTRSDGTTWVGTPLFDASGDVNAVKRSISQLMTSGGTVSFATDLGVSNSGIIATNRQVTAQSGSVINVAGGKITFLPGMVPTTRLLGADGRMYSMANADPNMTYVGIAGQFTVDHTRWGVKETWSSGTQTYSPGYTEGHDAGGVTVTTVTPQLNLGGQMYFGAVAGERQVALGIAPSDTKDLTGGNRPAPLQTKADELPSQGFLALKTPSDVQIGPAPSLKFNAQNALTQLSADTLSGYGLSALAITAYDLVVSSGSNLRLAAGGQLTAMVGGAIDVAGSISAAGGKINLSTRPFQFKAKQLGTTNALDPLSPTDPLTGAVIAANVFVEGSLDVSGRFVNDTGRLGADALGPGFINGGSISITTDKGSDRLGGSDLTGSILLASGSLLDVSSGGYISPVGKPKVASTGVMAGKGGNISLALYQGTIWSTDLQTTTSPFIPSATSQPAVLQLDGNMLAYGFESNGSLTLGVGDTLRIGGTLQPGEISTVRVGQGSTLPIALLASGGFASYTFESIDRNSTKADTNPNASITVSANVNLTLQQRNLSSTLDYAATPTGTKLGAEAQQAPATRLALLPDDRRKPVDLTLKANTVTLDSGSSVVTDPKAKITLGGSPDITNKNLDDPLRDQPANSVRLRGSIVDHGGAVFINAVNTVFDRWTSQQQARIDLSGTFIANSLFGQPGGPATSGTVIKGGTLSIEGSKLVQIQSGDNISYAYDTADGSVVADSGLQVDVSGHADVVQIAAGRGSSPSSIWLWSDAGTLSFDIFNFAWAGSFAATGGRLSDGTAMLAADGTTPVANNGTLILGGGPVSLAQSNNTIGGIVVSTDQLAPFDNVFLYSGGAKGGAGRIFTDLPRNTTNLGTASLRPLTIAGSLNWHVANSLHIAASSITMGLGGGSVALDAPYVLLTGGSDASTSGAIKQGNSSITVTAQTIDVEGAAFSGFKEVQLKSSGDLRLSTPKVANSIDSATGVIKDAPLRGALATYGDLLLSAQRIYPVSAVDFTITSTAGNVTFRAPGESNTRLPLSAGGSLTVAAANIDQGGNLFAPLGKITLTGGFGTNPDGTPQGVVLEPGSLTSVTLADQVVPYGATVDGTGWYYNSSSPLSAPKEKGVELGGASVVTKTGSTIDERGGGDLQAMEWTKGPGGSRDTLTSINGGLGANGSQAGSTVYALVPTSNDPVAAFDVHFTAATGLNAGLKSGTKVTLASGQVLYLQSGDDYPLAGTQITIAGGAGIAAGSYTLYPAHYATLPGALRVVYYGDNLGRNVPSGTTLPDGTVLVTGNYTQSTQPGKQSAGQSLFAVQTGAVWQQYSEYSFSRANSYFVQKATHDGTNVPRLPIDGGRLAVGAQQQILLAGTALSQPAAGGRGGELDISGNMLAVVSHQQYVDSAVPGNVPTGYIALDVGQLDNMGFESMLIGGTRSGTLITPTASNVLIDTRGEKLTSPEVLLVAKATSATDGSVIISGTSVIETTGPVHDGYGRSYGFVTSTVNGALFAASNDSKLTLSGPTGPAGDAGRVAIEAGATISTDTLTLQATALTNAIRIETGNLHVTQLNLRAKTFAIGSSSASAVDKSVRLTGSQFGGVRGLNLTSLAGAITVYGSFDPGPAMKNLGLDAAVVARAAGSEDGSVSVVNGAIILINDTAAALPGGLPSGSGNLTFAAADIVFGGGTQTIAGAAAVTMTATERVSVAGPGTLTLGTGADQVNLAVRTPTVLVQSASATGSGSFTLTTQGDVTFADVVVRSETTTRPPDSPEIGGNLAVVARSIEVGNTIQAQAGTVTLEATTGNVTLNTGAYIAAGGYTKTLVDFTTYVAGGKVLLQADAGNVVSAVSSTIDVARPDDGLGYGGQIQMSATKGSAVLLGQFRGGGGGGLGGSFKVDATDLGGVKNATLDTLADALLVGGLDGAIDIHTRSGNLTLSQGHTIKARSVTLTADDTTWSSTDATQQFGQITIAGTIDASGYAGTTADGTGQAGGQVGLYAANQVTLAGTSVIDASTKHADERGGDVTVGIAWAAKGKIRLQSGMRIDVTGGTRGGLSGGTVTFRAPVDGNGNAKIVAIDKDGTELPNFAGSNIHITGARAVTVEPFIAFDTVASSYGLKQDGWDGVVDPAGGYDATGKAVTPSFVWSGLTGYQFTVTSGGSGYTTVPFLRLNQSEINITAIAVMGLDGITLLSLSTTASLPANSNLTVTFPPPTNAGANVVNTAATGRVSTDINGKITAFTLIDAGSGYTNRPTTAKITFTGQNGQPQTVDATVSGGGMKVVAIAAKTTSNIDVSRIELLGGSFSVQATASFSRTTSLTGTTTGTTFKLDPNEQGAFVKAVAAPSVNSPPAGATVKQADTYNHLAFFDDTLVQFSQGKLSLNNQDYGFANLISALSPLARDLGAGVVHVRPGIELVNSDPNANSGNITVKSAWNLASGKAGNLQPNVQPDGTVNGTKYVQVYDSSDPATQSYVTFDYRYAANYGTGTTSVEPGALTLRAVNNVIIGASISDGFFQFRNYLDSNYNTKVAAYLTASSQRQGGTVSEYYLNGYLTPPVAPYNAAGNIVSPSATDLAAADLFPNQLRVATPNNGIVTVTDPGSWTYRITAGADLASANPNAVKPLNATIYNPSYIQKYNPAAPSQTPSVIITGQAFYSQTYSTGGKTIDASTKVFLPTMVRTGTGGINVAAQYDLFLNDPDPKSATPNNDAPGVIYAAGVNTPRLTDPNYQLQTVNGATKVVPTADLNDALFLEPQLLAYGTLSSKLTQIGPPTAAAFPHMGGDVQIAAQADIIGYNSADSTTSKTSYQYYKQWLLANSELTPSSQASLRGEGVFAPIGTSIASQTAWWIQYGSFQQGVLSAGGNVTVTAGRDINDLSVSLPTTGRVSGGLTATSTPETHVYDSGNMAVSAGRDLLGGSFYEGSGHGTIVVGRAAGATTEKLSWIGLDRLLGATPVALDNLPLLAVDLGRIQLTAGGSISIAGVINPAALRKQAGSTANPVAPENQGAVTTPIFMDTYGPNSFVGLQSLTGNLTIAISPTAISSNSTSPVYPAGFEAVALGGDIITTGLQLQGVTFAKMPGIVLSGSEHGDFQIVAQGSVDLTFGTSGTSNNKPYISAGPALLDKAFDPFRPDAWYGTHGGDASYAGAFSSAVLSHQDDDMIARIVAATGDIAARATTTLNTKRDAITGLVRVEINRSTEVYAGGDITDLNLIVQNIRSSDVSSVIAEGNITYTGNNIAGGLQVAGPGFFVVQAGGDLGPFLPVAKDVKDAVRQQQGIASVGNASISPVGNTFVAGGSTGIYNAALLGPSANATKRRNALLSTSGADVIAMFGVKNGINYQGVIDAYINPANSANVAHNYLPELQAFLGRIGITAADGQEAWRKFTNTDEAPVPPVSKALQQVFVDQVFFAELKAGGQSDQGNAATPRGYKVIETMFPSRYGYTANDGSAPVKTGDLNLLHATIQTRLGGDISIFGPGGSIFVGPLAPEPNTNLKLSDLGILTLGGGAINTFTDESVRVNSSRVLTTQGGDVLMWSSNGDLDAGRGSKTTLSLPPLQVLFDADDYETVDLGGFVSGAGIGTVKASRVARSANVSLVAPRGVIDFGVAGGRSSGNLNVVAPVVLNPGNIQVQGTATGIPVITVPVISAGLATAGNSAATAAKSADTTNAGGNRDRASVFIVEVVGYGGGDGTGSIPASSGETPPNPASPSPATPPAQDDADRKKKAGNQP